jgi:endogenous inhibitor of DNA gyrase (YacG/DUF329 family)
MKEKVCSKCGKKINVDNFSKDSSKIDGLYSSCRKCNGHKRKSCGMLVDSGGYLSYKKERVHRIITEMMLGRKLSKKEVVHHINGDKLDNRFKNLQVMTHSEHSKLHFPAIENRFRDKEVYVLNCFICGKHFESKNKHSKYCSKSCIYKSRIEYFNKWKKLKNCSSKL